MTYNYDRSFKFKLNDDIWEAYIITEDEAKELDDKENDSDDGFCALTLRKDNKCHLFIVEKHITKNVITHELFHIYVLYMCLESATGIEIGDFEEIIAEFLEYHLDKFIKMRNKLYKKFKKLEDIGKNKK